MHVAWSCGITIAMTITSPLFIYLIIIISLIPGMIRPPARPGAPVPVRGGRTKSLFKVLKRRSERAGF